jgi:PAS domain S-box-containing protein
MGHFFLSGGGSISEQIEAIDWENNLLGPMENWPESLKSSLNLCLNSPFPMLICWGPEMIMLYNKNYTDFLNDPYAALGSSAKETWKDIWDIIGPMLEGVRSTGKSLLLNDQLFFLEKNGVRKERYFTFSYSPLRDKEKLIGVLTIVHETTEKVLYERLTKLEQERMQRLLSQAPAAVCILDGPDLVFERFNENYQQLFPGRDLLGKSVLDALPEIKGEPIHEILVDVYQTGKTFEGRELLVPLSRSEGGPVEDLYFNFIYQARLNVQKEIDGVIVFAYEVTEFVKARETAEKLNLQVEQHAKIFDVTLTAIQDMVYTFDTDGRFTYSNYPLLGLLGITLDQIIGKNFHDLPYPQELASRLQSQISAVIETGQPVTDDTLFTSPNGKVGYYEYIFTPVFDGEGKVVLVAGSTRDISERKRSEEAIRIKNEELTHLNNQLMRVNSDLDNFIYTASHDLKSPISNIEGLVNALEEFLSAQTTEHPRVDQLLAMIQASIERFNRTINDLSDITKVQRLNDEEASPVNLEEIIEGIQMDLSFLIQDSKGQVRLALNGIKFISFPPKNLRSIFYNLIGNSLKYRAPDKDPIIEITGEENPEFIVITVKDNGMGMDLTQGPSIFGMFQRLHNHVDGTGIGLYIVKRIMDNSEGKIEVESEVGVGSIFKLYFKQSANGISKPSKEAII